MLRSIRQCCWPLLHKAEVKMGSISEKPRVKGLVPHTGWVLRITERFLGTSERQCKSCIADAWPYPVWQANCEPVTAQTHIIDRSPRMCLEVWMWVLKALERPQPAQDFSSSSVFSDNHKWLLVAQWPLHSSKTHNPFLRPYIYVCPQVP